MNHICRRKNSFVGVGKTICSLGTRSERRVERPDQFSACSPQRWLEPMWRGRMRRGRGWQQNSQPFSFLFSSRYTAPVLVQGCGMRPCKQCSGWWSALRQTCSLRCSSLHSWLLKWLPCSQARTSRSLLPRCNFQRLCLPSCQTSSLFTSGVKVCFIKFKS